MIRDIIALLETYDEYGQTGRTDLLGFAYWLLEKTHDRTEARVVSAIDQDMTVFFSGQDGEERMNAQLHFFWGQVERFRQAIIRRAFQEHPLSGIDEYSLLVFIELDDSPSVSRFADYSLLEPTTCVEMVKRLKAKKLIDSLPHPDDRRVKLLHLTPQGQAVLTEAKKTMIHINRLLYRSFSMHEKASLLVLLNELFSFRETQKALLEAGDFQELIQSL